MAPAQLLDCMICIDSMLDKLQLLVCKRDFSKDDDHDLYKLNVELRLFKTFALFARELTYFWAIFEDSLCKDREEFYSLLRRLKDGLPSSDSPGAASDYREILKNSRQEISEAYVEMSDSLSDSLLLPVNLQSALWRDRFYRKWYPDLCGRLMQSSNPRRDEFMEAFQSLLENLVDILIWCEAYDSRFEKLLEPLQEKLVFLKHFILFARLHGKYVDQLVKHCGFVALSAAHLCYLCWFFREDDEVLDGMDLKISELKEKIKPGNDQVRLTYIGVLETGSLSLTLSTMRDMSIVGDYLGSLLGNLWDLLLNCPSCFMVSLKHQMRMLYMGLRFLRDALKKQQEKYDGLPGRIKDLIGAVVNDAGIVIFSLYQNDIREASAKEMDVKIFCLLEKINLIEAEVNEKYSRGLRLNFPIANAPGLIDVVLEKLKELASCKVDPICSFAQDGVEFLGSYLNKNLEHPTRYQKQEVAKVYRPSQKNDMEQHYQHEKLQPQRMQEDLLFLRSFLENNLKQHIQNEKLQFQTMQDALLFLKLFLKKDGEQCNHEEELQALRHRFMEVAYKAEFVIDSLIAGDISFYSLMLFDNVTAEIMHLQTKISEIDGNKFVIEAQQTTRSLGNVPSRGIISTKTEGKMILSPQIFKQVRSRWSGASHQVQSQGGILTTNKAEVGLKDQEQAIMDQLIRGPIQLDIISIVGMPGLGKTFLAQRVYHDCLVTSHFHVLAWCCISQTYSKKDLLLEILACIDKKAQYSEMNEDDLAGKLHKRLKEKKYLIVLDDVWDIEAWNALKLSFPDDTNGSRILLTSRQHQIAGKVHLLRLLTEEESWKLLQKKLAIAREVSYPPEQNLLGRQIAKNCNGLPLSIVIISGILAALDQAGWAKVAERLSSNMVCHTEQCNRILELSYRHLPNHLKPCLLYFGAFREDQEIPIRRLIWLWIAEGFVQQNESESLEEIAEGYLMALINRSLVMVGQQRSIGGVKTCRIHDLLHLFCLEKAKDQNFLHLIRGYDDLLKFNEPHQLRRLSIYSQPKHFVKSRIFCPHICSLLHSSHGAGSREVLYNLSFIFHLKLLRVLDLGQISLGFTLPSELGLLVLLRYLAVLGWIRAIPSSLGKLSNLETLVVTTYYSDVGLSFLQETLWKMQKLRHLHVSGALIDLRLANDNCECSYILYNLDTFSTPNLYLGQSMEKMMRKVPNIRELKCCILESKEFAGDSKKIMEMDHLSQLESLKLLLSKVSAHLIEFHFPMNLKKLTLEDFSWSIISTIRELPNLEVLKLLRQADAINEWDMEEEECFPKLKFLNWRT